jgi:four helix bundle protein
MEYFDYEKLDVYRLSIDFIILANEIAENLPKGRAYLVDQLQRASTSVLLNIAEGGGEYSVSEKSRFYRMAKRSATECSAIFDICFHLLLIDEKQRTNGRELLIRIVSMLTKLAKNA